MSRNIWVELWDGTHEAFDGMNVKFMNAIRRPGPITGEDIVLFTGGADVYPGLYGEGDNIHPRTRYDIRRDDVCTRIYKSAKEVGAACVGICRGSQFLNVMNGGKLHQDVSGHAIIASSGHNMLTKDGRSFQVTSTHHQMHIPGPKGELLAWAHEWKDRDGTLVQERDSEVVWYDDTQDLCIQYHPEYMKYDSEGRSYFRELMEELYNV